MRNFNGGIKFGFIFVLVAGLTACGPSPNQQAQYVPQPAAQVQQYQQLYQQQPVVQQHDGIGTGTAIVGATAIGTAAYLAGKNSAEKQPQTTNVYRPTTTISALAPAQPKIQAPVAQASPAPVASAPKQTFTPVAATKMVTVTTPKTSVTSSSSSSSFKPSSVAKRR
jgi:hypothetical protein